jgi:4-amino-4-deoxy-L-arabinose transferase-like glycosyltransferase
MAKTRYYELAAIGVIFGLALLIRLQPVVSKPEKARAGLGPYGDTHFYHRAAYNLCNGNGFSGTDDGRAYGLGVQNKELEYEPAISRGPVYPFFMCGVYKFLGNEEDMKHIENWHNIWDRVRIVQCVMDAGVCLLVFFCVRLIYPASHCPAYIASILYCFSLYNIFYTRALLSESLTTFLVCLFIMFYILALAKERMVWWLFTGVTLGLVVLARFEYVLFVPVLSAYICLADRKSYSFMLKNIAVYGIGVVMVLSPWTLRNYLAFKELIPVSTGTLGYNLWLGTFETDKIWHKWGNFPNTIFASDRERDRIVALDKEFNRYLITGSIKTRDIDRQFMKLAWERIKNEPADCSRNWIKKIPRLWYQSYIPMYRDKEPSGKLFIFYLLSGAYGFFVAGRKEKVLISPICLLFIYLSMIFLPLHVEPRYGVALMPGIICLSGIGIGKASGLIYSGLRKLIWSR